MRTGIMERWGIARRLAETGWNEAEIEAIDLTLYCLGVEDVLDTSDPEEIKVYAKFENADSFRFAHAGNATEVAAYMDIYNRGCCGEHDELIVVDGVPILLGFNYGH